MKSFLSLLLCLVFTACSSLSEVQVPEGPVQIIGPQGVNHLISEETGGELDWAFDDGVLTINPRDKKNSAITAMPLNDFKMHIEFNACEQGDYWPTNGNSGVYIQQRYEVQILNSFNRKNEYTMRDCASIYNIKMPDALVCLPAGEWQSYDIEFTAARWNGKKKMANARMTLIHNGVLVHDNVEIPKRTQQGKPETAEALPLRLQDHSNPVKFRNFWIMPLSQ